ncbi:MAG: beta-agarase [Planctomycetota bacterium]|nr:MAG: beta-agarase [Planctomycetota bacterium]
MRLGFTLLVCVVSFGATTSAVTAQEKPAIRIEKINERSWLVDSEGKPFFAHGVTHIGHGHEESVFEIAEACRKLGFNAYGYGCPDELKNDLPYLEGRNLLPISMYRMSDGSFHYVDIFDPDVQEQLTAQVRSMCLANRDNKNLIGYCWTDLGAWPLKNPTGQNWVQYIRELPPESPGRQAYAAFLENWKNGDDAARDAAFLRRIAREYFRVLGEANRKYDPHHLIFGDRFAFNTISPEVLEEMLPWVDAVVIQPPFRPGFPRQEFDRIHRLSRKPILICDFAIRFKDPGKQVRGWKLAESPAEAGKSYAEYVRNALQTPYILGIFWCNPVDSDPGFRQSGVKQGIFDRGLVPRPELNAAFRDVNAYLRQHTPNSE